MKTGANSLMNDKDIQPQLPECDLSKEEDTGVDVSATPDVKSVEMLSSSASSVSSARSSEDSAMTAFGSTYSEGEGEGSIENDDDELLDLLVETLDGEFDHDLLL